MNWQNEGGLFHWTIEVLCILLANALLQSTLQLFNRYFARATEMHGLNFITWLPGHILLYLLRIL